MEVKDMDNNTFLKVLAEQKAKVKKEKSLLYELEEELEKRLNGGKLNGK